MYGYLNDNNDVVITTDRKLAIEMTGGIRRHIRRDFYNDHLLSTVFLIVDVGHADYPMFFETALFPMVDDRMGEEIERINSGSFQEAVEAHDELLSKLKNAVDTRQP